MASIEARTNKKNGTTRYRVYWNNPFTQAKDRSPWGTKEEAERTKAEIEYRLKVDRESFRPANNPRPEAKGLTVAELCVLHLNRPDIADSTRKADYYHIRSLLPALGSIAVIDLRKQDLKTAEAVLRERGVKQSSIQRRIAVIRAAINWAVEEEIITNPPHSLYEVRHYRCPHGKSQTFIPPTPEETAQLYEKAPPHVRRCIVLGFNLGTRIGPSELLGMKWEDFSFPTGTVRIWSAEKNPSKPYRLLKIKADILPLITGWRIADHTAGIPYVIHWRGKPIKSFKTAWTTLKKRVGITRPMRPYDLRAAFVTYALAGGADEGAIADAVGHNSTAMIRRHYQHVLDEQKSQVVDVLPTINFEPHDDE